MQKRIQKAMGMLQWDFEGKKQIRVLDAVKEGGRRFRTCI
jgi:hypothetical protein